MYFFDLHGLKGHLKERRNTEYESLQYTMGVIVVSFLRFDLLTPKPAAPNPPAYETYPLITFIFIAVVGSLIACAIVNSYFKSNGGRDGKDFLHRTLALSWVIGWRVSLILMPSWLFFILFIETSPLPALALIIPVAIASALYYFMTMKSSLREIHAAAEGRLVGAPSPESFTNTPEGV